jgi:hypothetical protein
MNRITNQWETTNRRELDRVVEPLANYICATEQPGVALRSVLSALLQSVEETNRIAKSHFGVFANGGLS